jgi:23S rRNA pseudouridine2605 synthase
VNGVVVMSPAISISPGEGGDAVRVTLDRVPVDHAASQTTSVYIMHKLPGEIVSTNEPGRRTIFERLSAMGLPEGLKAVGRLDMASEGLLLLTNNTALKRYLEHPASRIPRVYRLRVYGHLVQEFSNALRRGTTVDGVRCAREEWLAQRRAADRVMRLLRALHGSLLQVRPGPGGDPQVQGDRGCHRQGPPGYLAPQRQRHAAEGPSCETGSAPIEAATWGALD